MFNVRTKGKKFENYVVTAIYNRLGEPELMPITQQYVQSKNENRGWYLLDLYFPQIKFAVEIDEAQHLDEDHKQSDEEREKEIWDALGCEFKRIAIFEKASTNSTAKLRGFADIESQINNCVEKIKECISKLNAPLKWLTNDQLKNNIFTRGYFDIDDEVNYNGIDELSQRLTGKKQTFRSTQKLSNNALLWVPSLAIRLNDGTLVGKSKWLNELSSDATIIKETENSATAKLRDPNQLRVTFMNMKDVYGRRICKFIGVFKYTKTEQENGKTIYYYERVDTKYKF